MKARLKQRVSVINYDQILKLKLIGNWADIGHVKRAIIQAISEVISRGSSDLR